MCRYIHVQELIILSKYKELMSPTELKQRYTRGPERGNNKRRGDDLRGCLRKNLQVNMWLKNRFLSYSTNILKIYMLVNN